MFIDIVPNRNSPPAILLRVSEWVDGRSVKRTIANLTGKISMEDAHKIKSVLKGADIATTSVADSFKIVETKPHGHVAAVLGTIDQLDLPSLLGKFDTPERRSSIAMIAGRVISPGSKLALSRALTGTASTLGEELNLSEDLTEKDLYSAMKWLLDRQSEIENRLAKRHLPEGVIVLYDLSSSYYEGSSCPLAQFGHNRDGKKGKKQINYGVLTTSDGCPISIDVYPGNTADPSTVSDQLRKLRKRFGIKKAIVVGDRGMLTTMQLDKVGNDPELSQYGWISSLKNVQIEKLVNEGDLQPDLFDQSGLAEISSDQFPNERLVVCRNPRLATERTRKRQELLTATEKVLTSIANACSRKLNPYRGKAKIGARVQREAAKYKVLKHFDLTIEEDSLSFVRNQLSIDREASLDGIYVIRAKNVPTDQMTDGQLVSTYKMLAEVEKVFRGMKTTSLNVRPVFHRLEDMVRAHLFLCMLAYYVQWHMEKRLAPILFRDEDLEGQKNLRTNPVEPTPLSTGAKAKKATKKTADGHVVHSFRTLLSELGGICRVKCRAAFNEAVEFVKKTELTPLQEKAFECLGFKFCP